MRLVPVLEIGGSHVTAGRVDPRGWNVLPDTIARRPLDPHAPALELIADIADCAATLAPLAGANLRVAIPGPFDYSHGIGRYSQVGKFDTLNGVDVRAALDQALPDRPSSITFLNDAAAFTLGEWLAGAARGAHRVVGITLGTGVGSAFLDHGHLITSGTSVPPHGRMDLLTVDGRPLEDTISTRAIIAASRVGTTGVREVTELARAGDRLATVTLDAAFLGLGKALAPWLTRFRADALIIGGSIAHAWDIFAPALAAGLQTRGRLLAPQQALLPDTAGLIGAAWTPTAS